MVARDLGLPDVNHGSPRSRWRLLAPLRYLAIYHPEKRRYDLHLPLGLGVVGAVALVAWPKLAVFGEAGLLKLVRDVLIMAVPFMVGALATVAMGMPGGHIDRRPRGAELYLRGEVLTLRQFVCYLLGYLCFVSILMLFGTVLATITQPAIGEWLSPYPVISAVVRALGLAILSMLSSVLIVTVLWSLYFLMDVVNREAKFNSTGSPGDVP